MKSKQLCSIYDCEWAEYYDGVIIDNTVHELDKDGNILPTKELAWPAWDNIIPLMQFYVGDYVRDKERDDNTKDSSQWGFFYLHTGEIIVPPIYDYVYPFYGRCAKVIKNREIRVCFLVTAAWLPIRYGMRQINFILSGFMLPVRKGDKWGYIDTKRNRGLCTANLN